MQFRCSFPHVSTDNSCHLQSGEWAWVVPLGGESRDGAGESRVVGEASTHGMVCYMEEFMVSPPPPSTRRMSVGERRRLVDRYRWLLDRFQFYPKSRVRRFCWLWLWF